jgi:hypothetical protein
MKIYKDKYNVQIKPEFLFDIGRVYKSDYSPWVYTFIKIQNSYDFKEAPYKKYKIDVKDIAGTLDVHLATIYDSIKELENSGLIENKGTKHRLLKDTVYLDKFTSKSEVQLTQRKFPKFVQVYANRTRNILDDLKKIIPTGKKGNRLLLKTLRVYYYLIVCNRHCLLPEAVVESNHTQSSLERELKIEHRNIKQILSFLKQAGYIKIDESGKILTINKDLYVQENHEYTENTENTEPALVVYPVTTHYAVNNVPTGSVSKVPKEFIGFTKSTDGNKILIIYFDKQLNERTTMIWCEGDGVPTTREDYTKYADLMENGKRSQYYDPESYWQYKEQRKAFRAKNPKKAA